MPKPPFGAFTVEFPTVVDRIVLDIGISAEFARNEVPKPIGPFKALLDTGANRTVLSPRTILALALEPKGKPASQHDPRGKRMSTQYGVNIFLPNGVAIAKLTVGDSEGEMRDDAVLGMDVISQGDWSISNNGGKTKFSFRIPSLGASDFAQEANRISKLFDSAKRNDPCPCGKRDPSGKHMKFKNCCGR